MGAADQRAHGAVHEVRGERQECCPDCPFGKVLRPGGAGRIVTLDAEADDEGDRRAGVDHGVHAEPSRDNAPVASATATAIPPVTALSATLIADSRSARRRYVARS